MTPEDFEKLVIVAKLANCKLSVLLDDYEDYMFILDEQTHNNYVRLIPYAHYRMHGKNARQDYARTLDFLSMQTIYLFDMESKKEKRVVWDKHGELVL